MAWPLNTMTMPSIVTGLLAHARRIGADRVPWRPLHKLAVVPQAKVTPQELETPILIAAVGSALAPLLNRKGDPAEAAA